MGTESSSEDKKVPQEAPQEVESPPKQAESQENLPEEKQTAVCEADASKSNDSISNNSKETSSCEIIESIDYKTSEENIKKGTRSPSSECSDWVEDFGSDIEMTEEEISKITEEKIPEDVEGELEDDWENW